MPRVSLKKFCLILCCAFPALAYAQEAPPRTDLPAQPLSGVVLYEAMMAEIAALRMDLATATTLYLDLARRTRDPRYARRAAEVARMAGDLKSAHEAARLWLEFTPASLDAARMFSSVVAGMRGRVEELDIPLARMLAADPAQRPAQLMELPRLYAGFADRPGFLKSIVTLTEPYRGMAEARYARGVAQIAAGNAEQGDAELRAALSLKPDFELAALVRSQAAPATRRAEAMRELADFAAKNPKARDARVTYGRWLVGEQRMADAKEVFRALHADFPADHDLTVMLALLAMQGGDLDEGEKLLRGLEEAGYREDLVSLNLGRLLEQRGNLDDARVYFSSVGPGEHFAASRLGLAQIENKAGRLDAARAMLRMAAEQDPGSFETYLLAEAQMLRQAKRDSESLAVLDELLAKRPDQQEALYESALTADRLKRFDIMETRLRRAIALRPDGAHAYNALGYSFADRNVRLEEAEKLIAQALVLMPEDPAILDSMGWVRYRRGDLPGALKYLERAYSLFPDAEVGAHLGEVNWMLGKRDEARRIWDASRKASPDNEVLRDTIRRLTGTAP